MGSLLIGDVYSEGGLIFIITAGALTGFYGKDSRHIPKQLILRKFHSLIRWQAAVSVLGNTKMFVVNNDEIKKLIRLILEGEFGNDTLF